jgi:hypothetical protein
MSLQRKPSSRIPRRKVVQKNSPKIQTKQLPHVTNQQLGCIPGLDKRLDCNIGIGQIGTWTSLIIIDVNRRTGRVPVDGTPWTATMLFYYYYRVILYLAYRRGQLDTLQPLPPNCSNFSVPPPMAKYLQYLADAKTASSHYKLIYSNLDLANLNAYSLDASGYNGKVFARVGVDPASGEPYYGTGAPGYTNADLDDFASSTISQIINSAYPDAIPVSKIPDFAPDASGIVQMHSTTRGLFFEDPCPAAVSMANIDVDNVNISTGIARSTCFRLNDGVPDSASADIVIPFMWSILNDVPFSASATWNSILKKRGFKDGNVTFREDAKDTNAFWQAAINITFMYKPYAASADARNHVYNMFLHLLGMYVARMDVLSRAVNHDLYRDTPPYATPVYLNVPSNPLAGYVTTGNLHIAEGVCHIAGIRLSKELTGALANTVPMTMFNGAINIVTPFCTTRLDPPFTSTGSYAWRVGNNAADMVPRNYAICSSAQISEISGKWIADNDNLSLADFTHIPCCCIGDTSLSTNFTEISAAFTIFGTRIEAISSSSVVCSREIFASCIPTFRGIGNARYYKSTDSVDAYPARAAAATVKLDAVARETIQKSGNLVKAWTNMSISKEPKHNVTTATMSKAVVLREASKLIKDKGPYIVAAADTLAVGTAMIGFPEVGAVIAGAANLIVSRGPSALNSAYNVIVRH